jgi:hypothetical protein
MIFWQIIILEDSPYHLSFTAPYFFKIAGAPHLTHRFLHTKNTGIKMSVFLRIGHGHYKISMISPERALFMLRTAQNLPHMLQASL